MLAWSLQARYVRWPRELTALQPYEDECKFKKTCATIKTHSNTKIHPQIKKNIFISSTTHLCSKYSQHNQIQKRAANVHNTTKYRNAISSTTHLCSKYSQHNQIQKRAANVHNTTKYRNALQITRSTTEMFPGNQISDGPDCLLPSKGRRQSSSMTPSVSFM